MPKGDHDWPAIRQAFEAGTPLRDLEARFGVGRGTISKRSTREGWAKPAGTGNRKPDAAPTKPKETARAVSTPRKQKRKEGQRWNRDAKAAALLIYVETGSALVTSQRTGIPSSTIRNWVSLDPEWADAGGQATRAIRDLVESEVRAIVNRALAILLSDKDPQMINAASKALKTVTETASLLAGEPTDRHEFITPEQIREAASRHFGFDLGRTAGDPVPAPEEVRH